MLKASEQTTQTLFANLRLYAYDPALSKEDSARAIELINEAEKRLTDALNARKTSKANADKITLAIVTAGM
jgi:hypothetical protein